MNDKPIHTPRDAHGHSVPPRRWRTVWVFALMPALVMLLISLISVGLDAANIAKTVIVLPMVASMMYGVPALLTGVLAVATRRLRTLPHLLQVGAMGAVMVALWELLIFHDNGVPFSISRITLVMEALGALCAVVAGALTLPRPAERTAITSNL